MRTGTASNPFMAAAVQELREKLIDVSKRNPLIAFRHSATGSTFARVVDELPEELFKRLRDGEMKFEPLPNPEEEPQDQKTPEFRIALETARLTDEAYQRSLNALNGRLDSEDALEALERELIGRVRESFGMPKLAAGKALDMSEFARANGFNPSFSLPGPETTGESHFHDNKVRVLYTRDRFESRLGRIWDRFRGHLAETGIHTLQMTFGFIEWREPSGEKERHLAPLLLLPVQLTRKVKSQRYEYELSADDEDLVVNIALQELLKRNAGLTLPALKPDDTPESYFASVAEVLDGNSDLRLERFVTLAVLPFPNMALWRDLDPAAWPDGELLGDPRLQVLLGAKDDPDRGNRSPDDIDIETLPLADVPPLVLSADVSQHSALVEVQRGASLALQGPPGTGKSQTITNLIAGALSRKQRVLFIAEKKAALEVVAKNLEELGFGPVMLSLHSGRAPKGEFFESLRNRLEARPKHDANTIASVKRDLANRQSLLKRYRTLLRTSVGHLGRPLSWLVWRELNLRSSVEPRAPKSAWSAEVATAERIDAHDLGHRREALTNLAGVAVATIERYESLQSSPWHAVRRAEATQIGQDRTLESLTRFQSAIEQVSGACRLITERCTAAPPTRLGLLERWARGVSGLPDVPISLGAKVSAGLRDPDALQAIAGKLRDLFKLGQSLSELSASPAHLDPKLLNEAEERVRDLDSGPASIASMERAIKDYGEQLAQLSRLRSLSDRLARDGIQAETIDQIERFEACIRLLAALNDEALSLRSDAYLADNAGPLLSAATEEARRLVQREDELGGPEVVAGARAIGCARLVQAAERLDGGNLLSPLFSAAHRAAMRLAKRLSADLRLSRDAAASRLRDLAAYDNSATVFEHNRTFSALFGTQWRGVRSSFEAAAALRLGLGKIAETYADAAAMVQLKWFVDTPARAIRSIAAACNSANDETARLSTLDPSVSLADLSASTERRLGLANAALDALRRCSLGREARIGANNSSVSEAARNYHELTRELESAATEVDWFAGVSEDLKGLGEALELADAVRACVRDDPLLAVATESEDLPSFLRQARECASDVINAVSAANDRWSAFAELSGATDKSFFGGPLAQCEVAQVAAKTVRATGDREGLALRSELLKYVAVAALLDVAWIFDAFVEACADMSALADAFELAFVRSLIDKALHSKDFSANIDAFTTIGGAQLADASRRFAAADRRLERLEAERIVAERLADSVPWGKGSGPVGEWTEKHLVENEVRKKKRRITIRNLMTRAHAALQALKPAWLMSPSSVAQFVPPGTAKFDLIVIDEASQMTPEMAVGALARGSQVVIVGDPKQLPPSPWFQIGAAAPDDENTIGAATESESILDLAFTRLAAKRQLKWHYRSEHDSLIRFSNRRFYEDKLVVFPSPVTQDDLLGVKLNFVGGTYDAHINQKEAEQVLERLVGLIYAHPELSFGVVTSNEPQRQLVFEEFDRIKRNDPVVRTYAERLEGTIEEPFIKNLENVQGDERDVILISTVYGPPPGGAKVAQRFGIFNRDDGHRRLNVLVTRARRATLVFTSLRPEDIVISDGSSDGLQAFRAYLAYAANAPTAETEAGGEPDSDFEIFVAERLRAQGYEVVHQVGVEGFRIDLGVKHPDYPFGFLAGIECDGASFHSHLSVRDRDRIRQEVLERLGWRIWRVWSTDWFNNPAREVSKLLVWLEDIRAREVARFARAQEDEPGPEPPAGQLPLPEGAPLEAPAYERAASAELGSGQLEAPPPAAAVGPGGGPTRSKSPSGKRHQIDGGPDSGPIDFYESMPGYYEVWVEGEQIGSVERTRSAAPARIYGSAFSVPKPEFLGTRAWDDSTFKTDDIYAAVRRLAKEAPSPRA